MITIASTSYSVNLPNPTFGNTIQSNVQMSIRRTLSNKQRTIITSSNERTFNLTIPNITIQQKKDFEEVLTESDELTTYTDINSNDWEGYITNFPFDFVETYTRTRSKECKQYLEDGGLEDLPIADVERRYSCTINFKGNPV